jgi:hypothetical protein
MEYIYVKENPMINALLIVRENVNTIKATVDEPNKNSKMKKVKMKMV